MARAGATARQDQASLLAREDRDILITVRTLLEVVRSDVSKLSDGMATLSRDKADRIDLASIETAVQKKVEEVKDNFDTVTSRISNEIEKLAMEQKSTDRWISRASGVAAAFGLFSGAIASYIVSLIVK